MKINQVNWAYLARETFLLLVFAYVILLGGGFGALVDFRLQAFSTILATAVFGVWLAMRIIGKRTLPASGIDWPILLFLFSQFIAVAFSEDPRRSLPQAILWLVYVFVFYLALDLIRRGWPQSLMVKSLLIIGGVLLVFSTLNLGQLFIEWRNLTADLEFVPSFRQRLSTILGDPNLLAAITNMLVPLAMATFLMTKNNLGRGLLATYLVVSIVILYFTDSRGALLGFFASVGVFGLLWVLVVSDPAKQRVRKWAGWIWARKLLLFGALALLLVALGFVAWRFLSFEGDTTHAPALEARDIYWDAAIDAFQADLLTGAGPGLYPIYLMKIWSTPPARPYLHAHSFPFQVAAESGLLGLAALGVLAFAIAIRAWNAWRVLEPGARAWWAAAVASLVGLSAHSIVDDFFPFPAVGVLAFVYLAFVLCPKPAKEKKASLSPWLLTVPGFAAAAFTLYCLNAYWLADKAVSLGNEGDWEAAASEMQMAAESDPNMAFYWLQIGYAYGRLAETDVDFIDEAIAAYEKGIAIEPEYALSRANLAALLWAGGYRDEALHQMRIATSLAPEAWLLLLNEGVFEEDLGNEAGAMSSYSLTINFRPELVGAAFWNASELRATATQLAIETAILDDPRSRAAALVIAARNKTNVSEFDAARSIFSQAHSLNDQEVSLYVGFGELALANDELDIAEQYVQMALWIQATNNQSKVEAILLGAEISYASGDRVEALSRYEIAYNAIFAETSYGWGSYGWSPYAWFVFQRLSFPEDLLPQLERADITTDIATRLLPLTDLYEEMGEMQKAQEVSEALSPYLP